MKDACKKLGKNIIRSYLRDFRYQLIRALEDVEIKVDEHSIKVFFEGRFMSIRGIFEDNSEIGYLKPYLAIEFFVGNLALLPEIKPVTTLIKENLGKNCSHSSVNISCLALDETAAEKWVALTRRIAATQHFSRKNDIHLVRHLYDLYHLNKKDNLSGKYNELINFLMEKDRQMFKRHIAYNTDPIKTSKQAIDIMTNNKQWKINWVQFIEQMVYEPNPPSFEEAIETLDKMSKGIFKALIQ